MSRLATPAFAASKRLASSVPRVDQGSPPCDDKQTTKKRHATKLIVRNAALQRDAAAGELEYPTSGGHLRSSAMESGRALFVIAVVAAVLLMQPPSAHAQQQQSVAPVPQVREQEQAEKQEKAASRKETDEAYKATIKRIPEVKQSVDPWSNMRTAPQK